MLYNGDFSIFQFLTILHTLSWNFSILPVFVFFAYYSMYFSVFVNFLCISRMDLGLWPKEVGGGRTYGHTEKRTEGFTYGISPCVPQDIGPLGPLPKKKKKEKKKKKKEEKKKKKKK